MASQPEPRSSTHGTMTRAPPPPDSVNAPAYGGYMKKCPVLLDWWLEREKGEGGKIRIAGYQDAASANRNRAARVFTSDSIAMRHADGLTLETVDGVTVLIRGPLNITRMHQNGFPDEVSKWFKLGFPVEWEKHANSNMKPTNEHKQSPLKSTEYYIQKFLHGSFINSGGFRGCPFTGNDFNTSKGSTGNTDGPPIQRVSTLSSGTPRIQEYTGNTGDNDNLMSKMAASEELCNGSMDMHEESLTNPRETCTSGQADNQHESMHIDASEHEIINHSVSCVKQSTGSICSELKADGKRSAISEIGSFRKGDYGNRVQHGELTAEPCVVPAEECGSGQAEEECGRPKTFGHLGTEDALEVPTKGLNRQFGAVQGSEDNTIRRLRNGKVFGMSSGASLKKGYSKRKKVQHETFNSKMISNEEITPPADLTSCENVNNSLDIQDKAKQPSACMAVSTEPRRLPSNFQWKKTVPRHPDDRTPLQYEKD